TAWWWRMRNGCCCRDSRECLPSASGPSRACCWSLNRTALRKNNCENPFPFGSHMCTMRGPAEAGLDRGLQQKPRDGMLTDTEVGVRCAARSGTSVLAAGSGAEAVPEDL